MKLNSLGSILSLLTSVFVGASFGQTTQVLKTGVTPPPIVYKSTPNEDGIIRCHTMEMDSIRRANNPSLPSLWEEEIWLQKKIEEFKAQHAMSGSSKKVVITIPVVVHVIHNGDAVGSGENISDCQVESQITVMNQDFRRMMGTNGYNTHPDGADVEIEFCLAQIDPNGNPTNGINRVNLGQASWTSTTSVDNTVKPNTIWDPTQYMNMWTVRFGGAASNLLGYAQFPSNSGLGGLNANGGSANTDGVVAGYQYFGSQQICPSGTYSAPYNLGRTMTHEVGHFLGLRHIWGDSNCGNDFCADTPQSQTSNGGCPTQTTCDGIQDMVENYMDYTNDACMNIFTQDQKTRMLTVMSVSPRRASLVTSTVCTSPISDDAGISAITDPSGSICGSTSFTPVITLTNYGNNTLTSVTINYDVDGVSSQTYPWTGSLAPGASTTVTLPVQTTTAGAHTFNASTSNPNNNPDGNTSNDTSASGFTINLGGQEVTISLTTDCYGQELVWELFNSGAVLVALGGNQTVTTPVTATQNTATTDPGAYPNDVTINETLCLAVDCYDFYIWDAFGDGMAASLSGCSSNGDYEILDENGAVLASLQTANAAYQFGETNNFCVSSGCASTVTAAQTATETCNGDNTNAVTVTITGNSTGATYDIGSGASGSNLFTNLAQGSYTITVVDGDACTTNIPFTVTGPEALSVSGSPINISCNGQTDGQIILSASGGTPGYTYSVNGNATTNTTVTGLSAGSYTIAITDNNGCTASTSSVSISEPTVLTSSVGTITPELGGNDGSVNLSVSGGTAPYSYAWTGPNGYTSGVQDPNNMPGGTYNVTITDANGCTSVQTGIVVPSQLGIDENGNMIFSIYPNPSNGIFNVAISNPADEATIQVMDIAGRIIYVNDHVNGQVSVDLSSFANGNYMIAIDLNGATHVKRITLKK